VACRARKVVGKRVGKRVGLGGVGCVVKSMVGGRVACGNSATAAVEFGEHIHWLVFLS
jgi:hypothetical protein